MVILVFIGIITEPPHRQCALLRTCDRLCGSLRKAAADPSLRFRMTSALHGSARIAPMRAGRSPDLFGGSSGPQAAESGNLITGHAGKEPVCGWKHENAAPPQRAVIPTERSDEGSAAALGVQAAKLPSRRQFDRNSVCQRYRPIFPDNLGALLTGVNCGTCKGNRQSWDCSCFPSSLRVHNRSHLRRLIRFTVRPTR